jgi:hypothetical protein
MPTIKNIVDELRANVQGGYSADDSRLDELYLRQKINTARAAVIAKYINTGGRINSAWVQQVDINQIDRDEECSIVTFECPTVIYTNGRNDGFVYVGHNNGLKPFIRVSKERVTLAQHSLMQTSKEILWDFRVGLQNKAFINCYGNRRLEYIMIRAIFNDPLEVPGYREDTDMYPIDASLHNEMIQRATEELLKELRVQPDHISDGADKPTR